MVYLDKVGFGMARMGSAWQENAQHGNAGVQHDNAGNTMLRFTFKPSALVMLEMKLYSAFWYSGEACGFTPPASAAMHVSSQVCSGTENAVGR